MPQRVSYRGRFAPTPSGPLHLGSLLTALASYLQARSQQGRWLIRVDDLDTPRCIAGADAQILRQLEDHGLEWDESPRYQSHYLAEYHNAFEQLRALGAVYPCSCTRALLAQTSRPGPDGPVYAGICRNAIRSSAAPSWRLRVADAALTFVDGWQGTQTRQLLTEVGDFVVMRADGRIAYQLACAVDEAAQGITEIVRGSDLLGSTFRQLYIQRLLHLPEARYRHLPVLVDNAGRKLSKQNHAAPIVAAHATANLLSCLRWLGQSPPSMVESAPPRELVHWAVGHWRPGQVPITMQLAVE